MDLLEENIPLFYISRSETKAPVSKVDILDRRVEVCLEQVSLTEEVPEISDQLQQDGSLVNEPIFPVGCILWAKIGKWPYWPCIVATQMEQEEESCHVKFFGDFGRNGWVSDFVEFHGREDYVTPKTPDILRKFRILPSYRSRWETAVSEAEEFLKYPIEDRLESFLNLIEAQKKAKPPAVKRKRKAQKDTTPDRETKRFKFEDVNQILWRDSSFSGAIREKSTELSESGISTSGSISPCPTLDLGTITPIRVTPEPMVKVPKTFDIEALFRMRQEDIHTDLTLLLRKSHRSVCRFCGGTKGNMVKCIGRCGDTFHLTCTQVSVDISNCPTSSAAEKLTVSSEDVYKCPECSDGDKMCFVCKKLIEPSELMQQCREKLCARSYHQDCLKAWPQAKMTHPEKFTCPQHLCHICTSDDPTYHQVDRKTRLLRCILCPSTYHSTPKCIPAGCELLSSTRLICPNHWPVQKHVNVNWCFICARGGTLLCCDNCPIAIHEACANITAPDASYICDDCESGRSLVFGDIVWAKQGACCWWPAFIVTDSCVPETLLNTPRNRGEIGTYFLGSHNWTWLPRKRMFLYQDDDGKDKTNTPTTSKAAYARALNEATILCHVRKQQGEEMTLKKVRVEPPPPYKKIKWNQPVAPVKMRDTKLPNDESIEQCTCQEFDKCSALSGCENRYTQIECSDEICASGRECHNRRFTQRQYPMTEIIRTQNRGWGLVVKEDLYPGDFVIEYVGEILNAQQKEQRIQHKQKTRNNIYYFLTLTKDLTIDAEHKGNESRFINHSCDPNCMAQTWTVKGATRVGIFAIKDIPKGTELTFDYQWENQDTAGTICQCGAPSCFGSIGGNQKPRRGVSRKVIVKQNL